MKKSSIIKISAAAVLILIILFIIGTLRYRPTPAPTFKFLSGRGSYIRIDSLKPKLRETRFIYSFEADYNDIVADANSELPALGYSEGSNSLKIYGEPVSFGLRGNKPMDEISVIIIPNQKMNLFSTPEDSDYKTPAEYVWSWKNGWVSVEIRENKEVSWFTYGFLRLLNKLRG